VRVVFLTHQYPRWPGDFSGAGLAALARALVRRGHSVRVVAPAGEGSSSGELDGVLVQRIPVAASLGRALSDQESFADGRERRLGWTVLARLWRALKPAARRAVATGVDVVHAHWWIPAGLATPRGTPLVITLQGADAALLKRSKLARSLARPLFRRAAVVTATSRQAGESVQNLAGRFMGSEHIHPMPMESRGHPWTRGGGGVVVIGHLDRQGRVDLALETVAILASCGHSLPLTVIGDGPHRSTLGKLAHRLGVSALVRFLGPMPVDQARGHLARADLLLHTTRGDDTSGVALEALVTGVPVVACWDGGAVVDVVPESGAGRLSIPSADTLAENVLDLLADIDRLALTRLVGEAWRARLAPDHVAQLCEVWYRHAVAS
jgi:glycosyltransferase involved in cell wall biosynthesis